METQAAALADPDSGGEDAAVMDGWSPGDRVVTDFTDIKDTLDDLGPGSSALVAVFWAGGDRGGHWFNAVNDNGTVRGVDVQRGKTEVWPPTLDGLGYEESEFDAVEAIFVNSDGRHLAYDDEELMR